MDKIVFDICMADFSISNIKLEVICKKIIIWFLLMK